MKIESSFTHIQVVLNLSFFLLLTLTLFWRIWETKQLLVPSDFHILYVNLGLGGMSKNVYLCFFLADLQFMVCISLYFVFGLNE